MGVQNPWLFGFQTGLVNSPVMNELNEEIDPGKMPLPDSGNPTKMLGVSVLSGVNQLLKLENLMKPSDLARVR